MKNDKISPVRQENKLNLLNYSNNSKRTTCSN